jgi:CubicO group peptidase (beta-lactamase class C family)
MLTHTSGLPADGGYFLEPYPVARYPLLQQPDWITSAALAGAPLNRPGASWNSSTVGFSVLGEVVSPASGRHYDEYVEAEVFAPLGMNRSFFRVPAEFGVEVVVNSEDDRAALGQPRAAGLR